MTEYVRFLTFEILMFLICYFLILAYMNVTNILAPVFPLMNPGNKNSHDFLATAFIRIKNLDFGFSNKSELVITDNGNAHHCCHLPNPFHTHSLSHLTYKEPFRTWANPLAFHIRLSSLPVSCVTG